MRLRLCKPDDSCGTWRVYLCCAAVCGTEKIGRHEEEYIGLFPLASQVLSPEGSRNCFKWNFRSHRLREEAYLMQHRPGSWKAEWWLCLVPLVQWFSKWGRGLLGNTKTFLGDLSIRSNYFQNNVGLFTFILSWLYNIKWCIHYTAIDWTQQTRESSHLLVSHTLKKCEKM